MEEDGNSIEDMDQDDSASADSSSIGSMNTSVTQSSEKDPGLLLLKPLYGLLRGSSTQIICKILVTQFKSCTFILKGDGQTHLDKNLYDFLKTINKIGNEEQTKQNKEQKKSNQGKRSWTIFNVDDNKEILQTIMVDDMLVADEKKCQCLNNLDLNFLINIVTNKILLYELSESAINSINQVKDIRNELVHAKYYFSREDFKRTLHSYQIALQKIYEYFRFPQSELNMQIEKCKKEASDSNTHHSLIFRDLQKEIHPKYKSPQNLVCPMIRKACDDDKSLGQSLETYLSDHNNKPFLLCGKRGSGKASIVQNQAYQLVQKLNDAQYQGSQPQFSLVILFEENLHEPVTKENFWKQITNSMKNLAPHTAARYGIDILLDVIKNYYIKETIFFLNWNLQDISAQFREDTSNGTWVFTYQGTPIESADWNILITNPLKDTEVIQLLKSLNPNPNELEIILKKYDVCTYKKILTTPDMVRIFNELNSEYGLGTEFELMVKYIEKKMKEGDLSPEIIRDVGKLSFYSISRRKKFTIKEVEKDIAKPGQIAFFIKHANYFELIHNTLIDFLASVYVINDLDKACKEWLNNASVFERVFKFTCSFWFHDIDHCWKETIQNNGGQKKCVYLTKMEDFLCKFISDNQYRTEQKKYDKSNLVYNSCSTMETDVDNPNNNMNDGMDIDVSKIEVPEMLMSQNQEINSFSKWVFLGEIDEACNGERKVLEMLADHLSNIKCWVFNCKHLYDFNLNLKRIQKILKKVKLSPDFPVFIKIRSGPNCNMLMNVWNMLIGTESLHDAVEVRISLMPEKKERKYLNLGDGPLKELSQLSRSIENAYAPVYITELCMPLVSPNIPNFEFSSCECIQNLKYLDTIVYDVNTLNEVLVCGSLPKIKSIKIYVDLKDNEQKMDNLPQLEIPNSNNINVNLTIVYFKGIQKLLNAFTSHHYLLSLSICGVVVNESFKLDISVFENMESFYLHCDKNSKDPMQSNCAHLLLENLSLPKHLKKLLLSEVQFYNDTNIHLFMNLFAEYNIQKIMILDSNLSLDGARMVLEHMFQEKGTDLDLKMNKKMKYDMSDSADVREVVAKKSRLPIELRSERQMKKPKGKELIITSNTEIKFTKCNSEQCQCGIQCTTIPGPTEIEYLFALIKEVYCYSILNFSFNNKNILVHKNLCTDLRVDCPLFKIQDNDMVQIQQMIQGNEILSNSSILQLFQSLSLTQSLYIEKTTLSYDGIVVLVTLLKNYKSKLLQDNEPFSLTVTSDNLPCGDIHAINSAVLHSESIRDLKQESCLQMLNVLCTCHNRCHILKIIHDAQCGNSMEQYKICNKIELIHYFYRKSI